MTERGFTDAEVRELWERIKTLWGGQRVGAEEFYDIPADPPENGRDLARAEHEAIVEAAQGMPPLLRVMTARELCAIPDPPASDLLLGPLVVRGGRTIPVGDTGHGKTSLALQLARGVLLGSEELGFEGAGEGPVVIVDLEQGLRSIKRSLREAGLDDRGDAVVVHAPDGLALDSADGRDRSELEAVVADARPSVVVLDPYYKAHRGDANDERAVVDLMRWLDGLRSRHGFALILPAHPRKDPTSTAARKLTLHDVAGSGAVVRGAEVVIALERLSHGYARLRVLKDRDGDLEVGAVWPLVFARGEGFKLDPKERQTESELEEQILSDTSGELRIVKEWAGELGVRPARAKKLLERLVAAGRVEVVVGPPGRRPDARCYRSVPGDWEPHGSAGPDLLGSTADPAAPLSPKGSSADPGSARRAPAEADPGSVPATSAEDVVEPDPFEDEP